MNLRLTAVLGCAAALGLTTAASADPTITEFPLPDGTTPQDIVLGPDGNLWFAEQGASKVGRVIPSDPPQIDHFPISGLTSPQNIAVGPDGYVYVNGTVNGAGGIGKILPSNPATTDSEGGFGLTDPRGIAPGPDGNLWLGSGVGDIVRVKPSDLTEVGNNITTALNIRNLTHGPDGNMWVTDFGGTIGKVSAAGAFNAGDTIDVPAGTTWDILSGPGGMLWYSSPDSNVVGSLTTAGVAKEYPVTAAGDQFGLTVGADGNLWVAQAVANSIGRLTPSGVFTEFTGVTAGGRPEYIAAGPGNTLWFTEKNGNRIGRVTGIVEDTVTPPPPPPPPPPPTDTVAPDVSSLALTATRFRLGRSLPSVAAVGTGTRIRFTTSEAGTARITFKRVLPGRRVGRTCRRPTRLNRSRPRCTRLLTVRRGVTLPVAAGTRRIRFAGRLSRRRSLAPGAYRLTLRVTDAAGNVSTPDRARFRLDPPRPRR